MRYKSKASFVLIILIHLLHNFTSAQDSLVINEIMAINNGYLADEDGDYSDWIEIRNLGSSDAELKDWYLSDEGLTAKWAFPDTSIKAYGFIVVHASGEAEDSAKLHTNFKLNGEGESLTLSKYVNGIFSPVYSISFPRQFKNISYGYYQGELTYMNSPTPGLANSAGTFVAPPEFSVNHGYFFDPFYLELSCHASSAKIFYTTDASTPSRTNGSQYSEGILIDSSVVIRAIAFVGDSASWSLTRTYLFPEDVIQQSESPAGYPGEWRQPDGKTDDHYLVPADYGMKQEIVNLPEVSEEIINAITGLPVVSIVSDRDHFFYDSTDPDSGGIYMYTGAPISYLNDLYHTGKGWVRPGSVEYFNGPNPDIDFQANCAVKLHGGGNLARRNNKKHSFRLGFQSDYGPSKLAYQVFGEGSPKEYDWLVLRSGFDRRFGLQIKDPYSKTAQRDMGQYSAYSHFVHLYLNGMYWGMYNLCERMDKNTMSERFGGSEEDYDVIKDFAEVMAGDSNAWDQMMTMARGDVTVEENYQKILGKHADGTRNPEYEILLDAENLADYILLNFYLGNKDWDHHNWIAARRKTKSEGFRFFVWDSEKVLVDVNENSTDIYNENRPTELFKKLMRNPSFKNLFISRVNKHFFGEGVLTPGPSYNRYTEWLDEIDTAVIAEAARWSPEGFERKDVWERSYHEYIDEYFPQRTEIVLKQLISAGYYPSIRRPEFNFYYGILPYDFDLKLSAPEGGEIFYTIDAGDPAYYTGLFQAPVIVYDDNPLQFPNDTATISARVVKDTLWSALTSRQFIRESSPMTIVEGTEPFEFKISAYPNPAVQFCTIEYMLKESADIEISIVNILGETVSRLQHDYMPLGKHTITWELDGIPPGVYFCILNNHSNHSVNRIKIVRK